MVLWPDEGDSARTAEHIDMYFKTRKNTPALLSEYGFASDPTGKAGIFVSQLLEHSKAGVLAQTSIAKYHRPSGFNNRHLFLIVLKAWKSKVKVPGDSVLGEGSLLPL